MIKNMSIEEYLEHWIRDWLTIDLQIIGLNSRNFSCYPQQRIFIGQLILKEVPFCDACAPLTHITCTGEGGVQHTGYQETVCLGDIYFMCFLKNPFFRYFMPQRNISSKICWFNDSLMLRFFQLTYYLLPVSVLSVPNLQVIGIVTALINQYWLIDKLNDDINLLQGYRKYKLWRVYLDQAAHERVNVKINDWL